MAADVLGEGSKKNVCLEHPLQGTCDIPASETKSAMVENNAICLIYLYSEDFKKRFGNLRALLAS